MQRLQAQLKEIDETRVDGNFVNSEGKVLNGSTKVSELLEKCLKWSDIVLEKYSSPQFSSDVLLLGANIL